MVKIVLCRNLIVCCILILFASNIVMACSGVHAEDIIKDNEFAARTYAAISIGIVLTTAILYFLRNKRGLAVVVISIMILALHPGWSHGAWGGDCGTSVVIEAKFFTAILTIGLIIQSILYFYGRSKKLD